MFYVTRFRHISAVFFVIGGPRRRKHHGRSIPTFPDRAAEKVLQKAERSAVQTDRITAIQVTDRIRTAADRVRTAARPPELTSQLQ